VRFKRKYRAELLALWSQIDELEKQIAEIQEPGEVDGVVAKFGERIEREVLNLGRAMRSSRWVTTLGSVRAFITGSSPALLGVAAVATGTATSLAAIPLTVVASGAAGVGAVQVACHLMKTRQEGETLRRNCAFSYLYSAGRKLKL
jgi:hypothetical protein